MKEGFNAQFLLPIRAKYRMVEERKGGFFLESRLIGRRYGNRLFFNRILKQFRLGNIQKIEQLEETVDQADRLLSLRRRQTKAVLGEFDLPGINAIGVDTVM